MTPVQWESESGSQPHFVQLNRGGCQLWPRLYKSCSAKYDDNDDDAHDKTEKQKIAMLLVMRLSFISLTNTSPTCKPTNYVFHSLYMSCKYVLEIKM